jgi:hypothetical protein
VAVDNERLAFHAAEAATLTAPLPALV